MNAYSRNKIIPSSINKNKLIVSELPGKRVLIIEDDYVNYLYLDEMLSSFKMELFRSVSIENAMANFNLHKSIDLVIISSAFIKKSTIDKLEYFQKKLHNSVIVFDDTESNKIVYKDVQTWASGVLYLDSDAEYFFETILDIIQEQETSKQIL